MINISVKQMRLKKEEVLYIIVKKRVSQLLRILVSTHCLSHIMSSFYYFEIGHVPITIINSQDPLMTNSNKLSVTGNNNK